MQRVTHQGNGRSDFLDRFSRGMGIVGVVAALAAPALQAEVANCELAPVAGAARIANAGAKDGSN